MASTAVPLKQLHMIRGRHLLPSFRALAEICLLEMGARVIFPYWSGFGARCTESLVYQLEEEIPPLWTDAQRLVHDCTRRGQLALINFVRTER